MWINDGNIYDDQPKNITTGYVICGRRHHNCYESIKIFKGPVNDYLKTLDLSSEDLKKQMGFITTDNRYVNRKEAWKIAKERGQIKYGLTCSENGEDSILISENLYNDLSDY